MKKRFFMIVLILAAILVNGCVGEMEKSIENQKLSSPFGVAFGARARDLDHFMDYIHDLGVNRTKVSVYWSEIEPEDGVFNWSEVDEYISQIGPEDKALLNIFTDGWCTNGEAFKGSTLKNDECKEKYREFIIELVKHTGGKIKYWQRDTEPASDRHFPKDKPKEYVEIQKIFYEAVKSVQPDAIVIGVNNNGEFRNGEPVNKEFFEYLIKNMRDYFDFLDVRLYKDKYDIPLRVNWFRNEMRKYGYEKPIVCTEFGGPDPREFSALWKKFFNDVKHTFREMVESGEIELSDEDMRRIKESGIIPYGISRIVYNKMRERGSIPPQIDMFLPDSSKSLKEKRDRIHFRDIVQRHLIILSSGVGELWYWNLVSLAKDPIFGEMRLMDPHGWRKLPPYFCYKDMVNHLRDVEGVERVNVDDEDIYLFKITTKDKDIKYVLWERRDMFYGEEEPKSKFKFNVGWERVKISDVFGNEYAKSTENGVLSLEIDDTPLYIEHY